MLHLYGHVTLAEDQVSARRVGLWAGRDLYRATPALTRDLGLHGIIRRTAPPPRFVASDDSGSQRENFTPWIIIDHPFIGHSIYFTFGPVIDPSSPLQTNICSCRNSHVHMYACHDTNVLWIICTANGIVSEEEFSTFITNVSIIYFFTNINTKQLS